MKNLQSNKSYIEIIQIKERLDALENKSDELYNNIISLRDWLIKITESLGNYFKKLY